VLLSHFSMLVRRFFPQGATRRCLQSTTPRFCAQQDISNPIKEQYDSKGAVLFYKTVMGGGEGNIHYGIVGKPEGEESVKELSSNTVRFMGTVLQTMTLGTFGKGSTMIDVGSGHGGAAHDNIKRFGCNVVGFNLCQRQNAEAEEAARKLGVGEHFSTRQGNFDQEGLPDEWTNKFDAAWSEEVFCHSVDKPALLKQVARVLKPGGSLVFTDIMAGETASAEDLQTFTDRNATTTMFRPSDYISAIGDAGLTLTSFTDMTEHLPYFFRGMVHNIDVHGDDMVSKGVDREYIANFRSSLVSRLEAHRRGCFAFALFGAKKPSCHNAAASSVLGLDSQRQRSGVSSLPISGRTFSTSAHAQGRATFEPEAMLIVGGGCIGTHLASSISTSLPGTRLLVQVKGKANATLQRLREEGKLETCSTLPSDLKHELVLVATKTYSYAETSLFEKLIARVPAGAHVCFIHNGYVNYPEQLRALAQVSHVVAMGGFAMTPDGQVLLTQHLNPVWLVPCESVASLLRMAGLNASSADYEIKRLEKFLVNGVANLLSVRTGQNCANLLSEHRDTMDQIFDEMYMILQGTESFAGGLAT